MAVNIVKDLRDIVRYAIIKKHPKPYGYPISPDEFDDVLRFMQTFQSNGTGQYVGGHAEFQKGDTKTIVGLGEVASLGCLIMIATRYPIGLDGGATQPAYQDLFVITPELEISGSYRFLNYKDNGTLRIRKYVERKVEPENAVDRLLSDAYSFDRNNR